MTGEAMVDGLLKAVKEQEQEIARLNKIIDELEKDIQKEIERTNDFILEESGLVEITMIRKAINDTRQNILLQLKKLKEESKNDSES